MILKVSLSLLVLSVIKILTYSYPRPEKSVILFILLDIFY